NLVPWPDEPELSEPERTALAAHLAVEPAGLPPALVPHAATAARGSTERCYLRARGLTHLRRRLTATTNARLCIGGKLGGSQGRYPGIVEEALLAIEAKQPLYVSGLFGG